MKDLFSTTGSVYPLYHWSSYSVWQSCNAPPLFCNKALIGWVPNIADHRASALFNLMDWLGLVPADNRTGTMQEEVCQREIWLLLPSLPNFEYKRREARDQDNSDNCFIVFMVNWDFYDVIYGQNQGQWPANVQIICKHGEITRLKNYWRKTSAVELNQKKITISQEKLIICPACWIFDEILTWLKYLNSLCEIWAGRFQAVLSLWSDDWREAGERATAWLTGCELG